MSRSCRVLVPALLAAIVACPWSAHAQAPAASAPASAPAARSATAAPDPAGNTAAAFYSLVRMEPVRDELKLDDQSKQKVGALVDAFDKQAQDDFAGLRALPPEQQQIRFNQIQEGMAKRLQSFRTRLEALLTPEQLKHLQTISFQMSLAPKMGNPQILQQLGLSEEQQQTLNRTRAELDAKIWQVQREMAQKALGLLTPEQLKKLQDLPVPGQEAPPR